MLTSPSKHQRRSIHQVYETETLSHVRKQRHAEISSPYTMWTPSWVSDTVGRRNTRSHCKGAKTLGSRLCEPFGPLVGSEEMKVKAAAKVFSKTYCRCIKYFPGGFEVKLLCPPQANSIIFGFRRYLRGDYQDASFTQRPAHTPEVSSQYYVI